MLSKLDKITRKITEWDVRLPHGQQYESLVFNNPSSAIRLLTVASDLDEEFRLLGSDETWFSARLARCTSLETLKLSFHNSVHSSHYDICHPDSLARPYPFSQTLTSLDLLVRRGPGPAAERNDVSLLQFASLFPNLQHLRLEGVDYSNEEKVPFEFPRLVQLELLNMDTLYDVVEFLEGKAIPKLERLEVGMIGSFDLAANAAEFDSFHRIAETLNRSFLALKLLKLHHHDGALEADLHYFKKSINCAVQSSWIAGRAEELYPFEVRGNDNVNVNTSMYGLAKAALDIASWTKETVDKLVEQKDVAGLTGLWKELRGVQEYQKWMED